MSIARVELNVPARPWNIVIDVAQSLPLGCWTLVGGLMTKVHALLEGYESRATVDVDLLVDVMSSSANISRVVACLKEMSFKPQEPGFHHSPFYRMVRDDDIVDILLADHLPRGKAQRATYNGGLLWKWLAVRKRKSGVLKSSWLMKGERLGYSYLID